MGSKFPQKPPPEKPSKDFDKTQPSPPPPPKKQKQIVIMIKED